MSNIALQFTRMQAERSALQQIVSNMLAAYFPTYIDYFLVGREDTFYGRLCQKTDGWYLIEPVFRSAEKKIILENVQDIVVSRGGVYIHMTEG